MPPPRLVRSLFHNPLAVIMLLLALGAGAAVAEDVSEPYFDFTTPESAQEWVYHWGKGGSGRMVFAEDPAPAGKGAGKLEYAFSQTGDYFVLGCTRTLPEGLQTVKLQVYGDNSGQQLSCRVNDRTGETFFYPVSEAIDWTGWKDVEITVATPARSWGGNGDKLLDAPTRLALEMKAAKAGSGAIQVGRITTVSRLTDSNQLRLRLKSAQAGNLFFTGRQEAVMQVECVNRGSTPKTLELSCRLAEQDGKAREKIVKPIQVPAQAVPVVVDLPLNLQGKAGCYKLTVELMSGEKSLRRETVSLGLVAPQGVELADSPFGLNLSLAQRYAPCDTDRAGALADSLGMKWSREEISWEAIEPVKGTFHWERLDRAVAMAEKNHVRVLGLIGYCASWARRPPGAHTAPPRDVKEYAAFVEQVVGRYKGKIKYWEIWNEPDSPAFWPPKPDVREYGALLKAAYQAAKRADPDCRVMTAGLLAGINHVGTWTYVEDLYKNGGKDDFDIFALHAYCDPRSPEDGGYVEKLSKLREIMTRYGDGKKPVWLTEEGWHTAPGKKNYVSEKTQAEYLVRSHVLALSVPGVEKFFWFLMSDGGNWESDPDQSYGILRSNWTPKPAGIAYAAMTRILGGAAFAETLKLAEPVRGQVFRSGTESILVLWNRGAGVATVQADLAPGQISGLLDPCGNVISAFVDNRFELTLTGAPVYLTVKTTALEDLRAKLMGAKVTAVIPVEKEPAETKVLDDFDDVGWGTQWKLAWLGSGHEGSVLSSSTEQVHGGKASGKLVYKADPEKGKNGLCYVEVDRNLPLPDAAKRLGLWVYGDNSGNNLSLRIQDADQEIFQYVLARKIDWTGWKYLEVTVAKPDAQYGGDKNGVLDYPLVFQGVVVGIVPSRKAEGTVYFDDLTERH